MPANNPLGYSFEPGSPSVGMSKPAQPSLQPPSAVEYRNLRIPNRQVPGQIAPQALLQGHGGQGLPDVQLLRQLMQAFAPQGMQPGVPMLPQTSQAMDRVGVPQSPQQSAQPPQAPPASGGVPRIIPGDDTPPTLEGNAPRTLEGTRVSQAPPPVKSLFEDEIAAALSQYAGQVPWGY